MGFECFTDRQLLSCRHQIDSGFVWILEPGGDPFRLAVDKTVENHQGAGSSYRFASNYVEQLIAPTAIVPTSGTR